MPVLDKQKLLAFSKKKAATPLAAGALAAKRAQVAPPGAGISPLPGSHAGPPPGAPPKPGTPPAIGKPPMPMPKVMPLKPPAMAPMPGHEEPHAEAPHPGEEQEVHIFELVEDAAQAAEGGLDQELEDTIAGTDSKGPQDPPAWALEPEKWAEAAEAVGLGVEGVQDKYEEPFVVTAYLYKLIGGQIQAAELPEAEGAEKPGGETDMTKKGAAAKALQARAAAKAPPPQAAG